MIEYVVSYRFNKFAIYFDLQVNDNRTGGKTQYNS